MAKTKAHIRYKLESGEIVPGCTTVLGLLAKPALIKWANNLGLEGIDVTKYVDHKAEIGTLAHAMGTNHLIGEQTDLSEYSPEVVDLAENCLFSFWEWEDRNRIEKVHWVEKPLVSERHKFGGTADIYCDIGGAKTLIDLKTGRGIYPEHIYQLAALSELLIENGCPVDVCRVVNIPRTEDEGFAEHILSEKERQIGWEIFLHLLGVYQLQRRVKNG